MKFGILLSLVFITACMTLTPRPPTQLSFQSPLKPDDQYTRVIRTLMADGFSISNTDKSVGLITTNPKAFSFPRGVLKITHTVYARVQVMLDGNSMKAQITFDCQSSDGVHYQSATVTCYVQDKEAEVAIQKEEKRIEELLRGSLGTQKASL